MTIVEFNILYALYVCYSCSTRQFLNWFVVQLCND